MEKLMTLWTGSGLFNMTPGQAVMIVVGLLLLYLAIRKGFEPLLLIPIGFGGILANIPEAGLALTAAENAIHYGKPEVLAALAGALDVAYQAGQAVTPEIMDAFKEAYKEGTSAQVAMANGLAEDFGYGNGMLYNFYLVVIGSTVGPLIIFMGVGAMTDFGPLLANPKTMLLGAAAQFGIFGTVLGAALLDWAGILDFTILEAAAIGIIGGADGPTSIYVSSVLAPHLLGAIAVSAYAYMAMVPMIQPPIMKALTSPEERQIKMSQLRPVSKKEKIVFPLVVLIAVVLFLPDAAPLLGMFCFGNLMRECGVVERLNDTAQNALINIMTIFLGLSVGSKLMADKFLDTQTLGILALGIGAFAVGTACGVLMAKLMNKLSKEQINPLIG
jgi:oxaloacetate decarboxylase beta subunit